MMVLDLFTRNLVGWSKKPTLSSKLAPDALMIDVWQRKLEGKVIVHSD